MPYSITLGGGALVCLRRPVVCGGFYYLHVWCGTRAEPAPHRTKVIHVAGAVLAVYPPLPTFAVGTGFDFEIEHAVDKLDSVPACWGD